MNRTMKRVGLANAAAAGLMLVLSACTGTGASNKRNNSASNTSAGRSPATFAVISHAGPGEDFWNVVQTGAMDAGKALGAKVTYQGDPDVQRQSQLIENAIAQRVDGLIVSMADPQGLQGALADAKKAGIPFVTINSGIQYWQQYGAITHIGQDDEVAGEAVGNKFNDAGLKNLICVIHEAGNIGLEQRCSGIEKTFHGRLKNIQVDGNNVANAGNTIKSALLADPSIDGVAALDVAVAIAAEQARNSVGNHAKIANFDVSSDIIKLVQEGKLLFAVDQQQYLQGYLPVVFLHLYKSNGNIIGGGYPVHSGPGFVTKDNAAQIEQYAANGTR
jgi:simple sugar transport system substrate-binding protein